MNKVKGRLFLKNCPLVPKMLLLTFIVGVVVWVVLDNIQTKKLQGLFDENMGRALEQRAHDDRTSFERHIAHYNRAARLIVNQKNFSDYVISHLSGPFTKLTYYSESPPWLPDASVMRYFIHIPYAVLIDGKGRVREIYVNSPKPIPRELLAPSDLLRDLSHNQSFMTNIDGDPFLLTSESLNDHDEKPLGSLLIAHMLDDDFLSASQNMGAGEDIVALADLEKGTVVASNRPEIIIKGSSLESYSKDYLIVGKSFFDWGGSDLLLQFSSLVSKEDTVKITASIIHAERLQRAILGGCLILAFSAVMYLITSHIRDLTQAITDFSRNTLGLQPLEIQKGDQLLLLEDQFAQFTREIINSREQLKRQAEELLREKTVYLDNILHSSTLAVIAMDIDLRIKYYNHVASKFFRYPAEEVIGKILRDLHFGGIIDLTCLEKAIDFAQRGNEYLCTSSIKGPDGERFYESRYNGIRDNKNELVGMVIMTADVTIRTLDENRLRKYSETQRILLQEVNHRVKNNLMIIISMLHKEEDRARHSGQAIYIPFLAELKGHIDGLLTVHSMLSSVNWQPLKLDALCDQIVKGVLKASAKEVVFSVSPSGLMVDSNQSHNLTLVLNELATNSLKYAVSGSVHPCVDIYITERDGRVCIIFRDNGPGFPETLINGNLQGTGAGFDLINGIAKKSMRGTMSFWNDNGAVSEICFEV
jgi:PAS domain S-box-containing protein